MTSDDIRRTLSVEPKSFLRTPQEVTPCDFFETYGAFCYYDASGRMEAVEFTGPAEVRLAEIKLLGMGFADAIAALVQLDPELDVETDGAIAFALGVSIYAPLAKNNPSAPIETVLVFRKGYYGSPK